MGPPRTRVHLVAQRGRFQEGSMNDRASAVPPLQFLEPSERAALERPLWLEGPSCQKYRPDMSVFNAAGPGGTEEKRGGKANFLGQMWEGVRQRLRMRRDQEKSRTAREAGQLRDEEERRGRERGKGGQLDERQRPTRDEVFANYHQLVASGFFSSQAIQSTRRHGPLGPSTPSGSEDHHPPQWPLAPFLAPDKTVAARPATPSQKGPDIICSPVSATSSRGTKRAAAASPVGGEAADEDDEAEDDSTLAHRFLPKRLRKMTSRDISLPRVRSVASRKNMRSAVAAARRSLSTTTTTTTTTGAQDKERDEAKEDEANRLAKSNGLLPHPRFHMPPTQLGSRASVDSVDRDLTEDHDKSSPGREVKGLSSARSLRCSVVEVEGRAIGTEPLRVVPDANRGIPGVPTIPAKFAYGEGQENGHRAAWVEAVIFA